MGSISLALIGYLALTRREFPLFVAVLFAVCRRASRADRHIRVLSLARRFQHGIFTFFIDAIINGFFPFFGGFISLVLLLLLVCDFSLID